MPSTCKIFTGLLALATVLGLGMYASKNYKKIAVESNLSDFKNDSKIKTSYLEVFDDLIEENLDENYEEILNILEDNSEINFKNAFMAELIEEVEAIDETTEEVNTEDAALIVTNELALEAIDEITIEEVTDIIDEELIADSSSNTIENFESQY